MASAASTVAGLDALIAALKASGYRVIGPRISAEAIVFDDVDRVADLPKGWTDEQDGGRYRLAKREDDALFGYAVGAHSWKRFLQPPVLRLWQAKRDGDTVAVAPEPDRHERFVFLGVRACDLHAIAIQDRVFLGGPYIDPHYRTRREGAFIVAVNCAVAGGTCFCVSMNTGPKASSGFDLALTEIIDADRHVFLVEAGSEAGREVLARLPQRTATDGEIDAAAAVVERTAASMGRQMRSDDLHDLLLANLNHPRWDEVAERCLTCANCTMVCPTCFCTSVEDTSALDGSTAERWQRWDSCLYAPRLRGAL